MEFYVNCPQFSSLKKIENMVSSWNDAIWIILNYYLIILNLRKYILKQ